MAKLLNQLLDEAADRRPEAIAARCDGVELSFGQLARRANGLARVLRSTGLERRDRVAILLGKGLDVPVALYGVMASGATAVPIDPKAPVEQIVRILRETGATCLVTEPSRRRVVAKVLAACPDVTHAIGIERGDQELDCDCIPWGDVDGEACDQPLTSGLIELDPCYILHTSGSTGIPKLILHTHASAMSFVDWAVAEYALTADDRLSNHSSHHTCFATFDYYAATAAGATTEILSQGVMAMPASLAALLERERVSVWYSVPAALVQLSLRGDLETHDLSALRWVLFAGETFPDKHLRRLRKQLPDARFSHVYGSTEVNVCSYYHLPDAGDPPDPLPIGRACSNAHAVVVDESLDAVPDGEEGELLVRSSTVMSGYWGDPERSREILVRLPRPGALEEVYYRTGDRARMLPDGNLTFVARADRQVKVRGHRVELEEVESALLRLSSVEEAAAFTVPDGEGSSLIRAAVVLGAGAAASERDLTTALRSSLPAPAVPERIALLGSFPRTPTGKVDRNALRAQLSNDDGAQP